MHFWKISRTEEIRHAIRYPDRVTTTVNEGSVEQRWREKGKLLAYAMKRVAVGRLSPNFLAFKTAEHLDDKSRLQPAISSPLCEHSVTRFYS